MPEALSTGRRGVPVLAGRGEGPVAQHADRLPPRPRLLRGRGRPTDGLPCGRAGPGDLERYLAALRAEGRNPASLARATTALRGLYRFLVGEGTIAADPTADVRSPKLPRRLPKALEEDQVLAPARVGRRGRARSTSGTGPCSRSSTAPGPASARWWGCRCST